MMSGAVTAAGQPRKLKTVRTGPAPGPRARACTDLCLNGSINKNLPESTIMCRGSHTAFGMEDLNLPLRAQ